MEDEEFLEAEELEGEWFFVEWATGIKPSPIFVPNVEDSVDLLSAIAEEPFLSVYAYNGPNKPSVGFYLNTAMILAFRVLEDEELEFLFSGETT